MLEACAVGCPVVTTVLGGGGLPTGRANGILVTETAARFATQVGDLLADPQEAARIGAAGQAMVRNRFDWADSARALQELLAPDRPASRARTCDQDTRASDADPWNDATRDKEATIHAVS